MTVSTSLFFALAPNYLCAEDFEEVARVLESRCVGCHNLEQQQGDLAMDGPPDQWLETLVDVGNPSRSRLLEVVEQVDGVAEMPKDGAPLTKSEVSAIRKWLVSGAKWPSGHILKNSSTSRFDWWSYKTLRRPSLPGLRSNWIRTEVDEFVLSRLQKNGLQPSPSADRRTLLRRLTYDLTGLPATHEEIQAFVSDPRPDAYERNVERLLASPAYGERWGRHWLDVVKYADTCGYDKDKLRPHAWPYRDYVIRSFNEDKPYETFVQEQVAGDVLFPGEPDGVLGLGFIAAGPWDFIGHVEVPESKIDGQVARNLDRDDMVSNTFNSFCSLTVQCARCHDHKFDPISQENYYALQAVFAAVDRADRPYQTDPLIERRRDQLELDKKQIQQAIALLEKQREQLGGQDVVALQQKTAALDQQTQVVKKAAFGYHSQISKTPSEDKWVAIQLAEPQVISRVVLHPCHDEYAGIGDGFGFPVRLHVEGRDQAGNWHRIGSYSQTPAVNPGLAPVSFSFRPRSLVEVRVTAFELAERKNDFIFALAELELFTPSDKNENALQLSESDQVTAKDSIEAPVRWARANLVDRHWPKRQYKTTQLSANQRSDDPSKALLAIRRQIAELTAGPEWESLNLRLAEQRESLKAVSAELNSLPAGPLVYAAATAFKPQGNFKPTGGSPREIHVLKRGDVQRPMDAIAPGRLPVNANDMWVFEAQPDDEGVRRASLARWLTDRENPFVWRSIVNRIWQHHFGSGLVTTPNDFGHMGSLPTHPDLLEWLADDMRKHQSLKRLHRTLVLSSTYQQASVANAHAAAIDRNNQLLWTMRRRKLSAEEIRDSIMLASGVLRREMGGPGYYLFELERVEHSPHYEYHKFDPNDVDSHRRSIYRFVVRSQPDPWMTTLDCADSSQSTPERNETLTALQSLALLNNRFNLAMAEEFAGRLQRRSADMTKQVRDAFVLTLAREPSPEELRIASAYSRTHGMANFCRLLFNLSEFVYVD